MVRHMERAQGTPQVWPQEQEVGLHLLQGGVLGASCKPEV